MSPDGFDEVGTQTCPLCEQTRTVLVKLEGYELSCLPCLKGQRDYHMMHVHDDECEGLCEEQGLAADAMLRSVHPAGYGSIWMLIRLRADGSSRDQVLLRTKEVGQLRDALNLLDIQFPGLSRLNADRSIDLGRGRDGSEYEAVRL